MLFLLYINDITKNISEIRLFADDCILYRLIRTPDDCTARTPTGHRQTTSLISYMADFNAKKCYTMAISHKRERPSLQYKFGDVQLSVVKSFTYLGVTISSDFHWCEHVHNISVKATRVLNFVRRNIYHCTPEVKALAYTSLIRPHLEYSSAAWDLYTARDSHQLDKVHHAARFVKRDYRQTTSVSELISQLVC